MRDKPLPPELNKYSLQQDLTCRGNNEWSASCPKCGSGDPARRDKSDRFRLFSADNQHNARVWCRSCGFFEWADQDDYGKPDPAAIEQANKERARLAEKERERVKNKIVTLQEASYWQGWYDAMSPEHRQLWHNQGIVDWAIDNYKLGYCPDHTTYYNGLEWHTPTMTIPHWGPGWELVNIQHRLLQPPTPGDKYRQMKDLPAAMFLTEPDESPTGPTIVVEGAKKAIVTYLNIGHEKYTIVAVPSKAPSAKMIEQLKDCDPVYLMLDPDAYVANGGIPSVNRVAQKLGRERVRLVKLPVKPDDLFTMYDGTAHDLMGYIRIAKPI